LFIRLYFSMLNIRHQLRHMPSGIWALGLVSMFMDISSELIHSLLPLFMSGVLGASMTTIGMIEGIAEATALIAKMCSGFLSDWLAKRKMITLFGYALSAITKPVFPLAASIGWVFFARLADRIGKGIRGAPRDALVADLAPPELRGAAFGLRQALDSFGACIGPLLAILFMLLLANDITMVLWIAVIPAFMAVAIMMFRVHDTRTAEATVKPTFPMLLGEVRRLQLQYWLIVGLGAVFMLARFSEAFLILRAEHVGLALAYIPVVMVVMSLAYAIVSFPAGVAADCYSRSALLLLGLFVLIVADTLLAIADSVWPVVGGAALWGVHMGLTQGLLAKLVADTVPAQLRGSAFGFFNLVSGVALLVASVIAGVLWDQWGPSATFWTGAMFAGIAVTGILLYRLLFRQQSG